MNGLLCDLTQLLGWLVQVYTIVLLIYAVLSWIPDLRGSRFEAFLGIFVDPLLAPLRRIIPPMGGLDIAFLVLIVILQFLIRPLVVNLMVGTCAAVY
ncbi:MAG TPA: YggT family protein [Candidatus Tyrphobacter sp.]